MNPVITGKLLRDAFISGANQITNARQMVDALNVFPVPDGDTGTNMSMTSVAAAREAALLADDTPVGEVAGAIASALLRGARGNSGVILSLLFRGVAKRLHTLREADASVLAASLQLGVDAAYQAVMKPTEGTILTVAREAAQAACDAATQGETASATFQKALDAARESLARTPELLPVLKEAGVVDAGGQGLVLLYEGMLRVFNGGEIVAAEAAEGEKRIAAGEYEGEITFTYCTEFIVLKKEDGSADAKGLRAFLEGIGDCVVVVDDDKIIKCHLHTDAPGDALQKAIKSGMLTGIKIENMREQHQRQRQKAAAGAPFAAQPSSLPYRAVDPSREYGFVAVAAGEGVQSLFKDLNVDNVVSGGQTMNPSTEELLAAVQATPSRTVFVLPNNKNIIMAAEQTIKLADRSVVVLQTRSVPQGLSAMLAFDPAATAEENELQMTRAFERVGYAMLTYAARDSIYEGRKIKADELLALENGKLAFTEKDLRRAVVRLTKSLLRRDSDYVTLIYGEAVSEELAQEIYEAVQAKLPEDVESVLISGGQPVYYFMISVE